MSSPSTEDMERFFGFVPEPEEKDEDDAYDRMRGEEE